MGDCPLTVSSWWCLGSITFHECNCSSSVEASFLLLVQKASALDFNCIGSLQSKGECIAPFVVLSFLVEDCNDHFGHHYYSCLFQDPEYLDHVNPMLD